MGSVKNITIKVLEEKSVPCELSLLQDAPHKKNKKNPSAASF